tara:strand:+ start:390 stop:581 length:192 start_codon:yes stop_codon:yes gene_type:complete
LGKYHEIEYLFSGPLPVSGIDHVWAEVFGRLNLKGSKSKLERLVFKDYYKRRMNKKMLYFSII